MEVGIFLSVRTFWTSTPEKESKERKMFDLQIVPGVDLITREKVPKQNRPNKNKYQES